MEKPTNLDQPAKEESNEALLNRWHQHRDHAAFQVLHDRLVSRLRRFLRRQIESKFEGRGLTADAVEEILQNVFMSVMRCRAPVRSVNGLLHKAAKRYLLKHVEKATAQMRDHHRTISWDQAIGPSGDYDGDGHDLGCNSLEDPKCAPARQQASIEANEYIERLPPPEAEALRLVDLEEYTIPAAAKALKLSESTTWSRVRSARQRIKAMATTGLILLVLFGVVFDNCNLDLCINPVSAQADNDDDEVCHDEGGHHESHKQRRKSVMRLMIWPVAANCRLAIDEEHLNSRKKGALAVSLPPSLDRSWLDREEDGRVLRPKVPEAARSRYPAPNMLQAA